MNSTIKLWPEELRLVQTILRTHVPGREVRAFGSRVRGTTKRMADLDLCIMGKALEPGVVEELRSAFSESRLPMKVDVVEWATLQEGFRNSIAPGAMVVQSEE